MNFILNVFNRLDELIHFNDSPVMIPVIIVLFAVSLGLLCLGLLQIKSQIKRMTNSLKGFDTDAAIDRSDYIKIQKLFLGSKALSNQWREFEECVVIDRLSDETEQYRNTVAANKFFNFEDVVDTSSSWIFNIKFNYFNAVPNLLTGLGIFGTFIGIIQGLKYNSDAISSSVGIDIETFINGLRVSFGTSICGLFLATLFTIFEKTNIDRAEHVINELAQEVDRLFKRKVEQEYLLNIANILEEQNLTLKTLATEIGGEIVKGITGMGVDTLEIGDNLKEGINSGFASLGQNLSQLNELHKTYQESAKLILDESKVVGVGVTYLNKAVQGYSGNVDDTSKKLEHIGNKFEQLSEKQIEQMTGFEVISENVVKATELSKDSIDKMVGTKNEFQKSFNKTTTDLEKMFLSFGSLVDDYNAKTQGALTNTFDSFDKELSKAVSSLGRGIGEMSDGVDNMAHYLGQLKSFVDIALKEIENKKNKDDELPPPVE